MSTWQVIHGDCLEVLKSLPSGSIDAVVTDPPYGVGVEYSSFVDTQENVSALVQAVMPELFRVSARITLSCGNGRQHLYPPPTWTLAWIERAGSGRCAWGYQCWQPILVYGKCPYLAAGLGCMPDIYMGNGTVVNEGHKKSTIEHPCPKPDPLMRWWVRRVSLEGMTILDPFCGSGTTGVACMQTGRNFIGIEIDAGYCEIARRRIADAANTLWTPAPKEVQGTLI